MAMNNISKAVQYVLDRVSLMETPGHFTEIHPSYNSPNVAMGYGCITN